eukprot:scaffold165037_cov37-Tisochrysis_lutea.AAC.2
MCNLGQRTEDTSAELYSIHTYIIHCTYRVLRGGRCRRPARHSKPIDCSNTKCLPFLWRLAMSPYAVSTLCSPPLPVLSTFLR